MYHRCASSVATRDTKKHRRRRNRPIRQVISFFNTLINNPFLSSPSSFVNLARAVLLCAAAACRIHRRSPIALIFICREVLNMKYVHPGLPGSLVSFRKRYGNYIGGKFVRTGIRQLLHQHLAGDRPADRRIPAFRRQGHRAGARRGARGGGRLGQNQRASAFQRAVGDRRSHRIAAGNAGADRNLGQRQTDPRNPECRSAAGGRPFPLLRRLPARAGRHRGGDRPEHRGLPYL